jgi:hypothetical protein
VDRWKRRTPSGSLRESREVKILDNLGVPTVVEFLQQKLEPFDTTKVWSIRLYSFKGVVHYNGRCCFPQPSNRKSRKCAHYRLSAGVDLHLLWPHTASIATGTKDLEVKDPRSGFAMQKTWAYVWTPVTFENATEALVFVLGHEVFHFLRHSRQIDGRQTEPQANKYGLQWLEEWRTNERRQEGRETLHTE